MTWLRPRLDDVLLVRLANHGILTQHTAKFLFIIPTMSWRVVDPEPEEHLCESLAAVMEGRVRPDARTGSIIALLSAAGVLPKLSASLPWNSAIAGHVQQIAMAGWATSQSCACTTSGRNGLGRLPGVVSASPARVIE